MTSRPSTPTVPTPSPAPADDAVTQHTRRLATVLACGFLVVSLFQVALALGAPFGAAAFGGADTGRLAPSLRLVSTFAAVFWILAALHALSRGGVISRFPRAGGRRLTWVLVGITALGTLMNLASSSPWERFGWAPYVLLLTVVGVRLARRP
ncbi:hypothetical protein [Cryptosporangium aurantiacum]|uniref:Uncharacterized protein n=1 Tax=Cryptosporangium aurantiacum TaxID=134849 RepID=A0A1M7RFV7_9ACTN|nr:hypothetical protein [Cryptosporangium aurantiacum]SHN44928.1 hypothetical protein SAMN05443668_11121 [Cryptosporangium aurantiacum]